MLKLFKQEKGKKMKVIFALIDLIVQALFWALVGLGKILMLLYRLATYLLKRLVVNHQQFKDGQKADYQAADIDTDEAEPIWDKVK